VLGRKHDFPNTKKKESRKGELPSNTPQKNKKGASGKKGGSENAAQKNDTCHPKKKNARGKDQLKNSMEKKKKKVSRKKKRPTKKN